MFQQECTTERVGTQSVVVWDNIFGVNVSGGLTRWQRSEEKPSHDAGYAWFSSFFVLLILEHMRVEKVMERLQNRKMKVRCFCCPDASFPWYSTHSARQTSMRIVVNRSAAFSVDSTRLWCCAGCVPSAWRGADIVRGGSDGVLLCARDGHHVHHSSEKSLVFELSNMAMFSGMRSSTFFSQRMNRNQHTERGQGKRCSSDAPLAHVYRMELELACALVLLTSAALLLHFVGLPRRLWRAQTARGAHAQLCSCCDRRRQCWCCVFPCAKALGDLFGGAGGSLC